MVSEGSIANVIPALSACESLELCTGQLWVNYSRRGAGTG